MKNSMIYVPILKWKQGEQFALLNLSDYVKSKTMPFICLMGLSGDPEGDVEKIKRFWGSEYPISVGFHPNLFDDNVEDLHVYMENMLNYAHEIGLKIVPIINVLNNDKFLEVISKHAKLLTNGVLLHLKNKDFVNIENIISHITYKSSFKKEDIILLFDFFIVDSNISPETYSDIAINTISKIDIKEYKSVVFSASSFPAAISGLEAYSISPIKRHEWLIWKSIISRQKDIIFGDYCCDDPLDEDLDFGPTIIPTIRYTKDDYWYIVRGKHDKRKPRDFSQFHALSQKLIGRKDIYCGANYSWGDGEIASCASKTCVAPKKCNHGHMGVWVKRNSNHHITYVVNQLSSYSGV